MKLSERDTGRALPDLRGSMESEFDEVAGVMLSGSSDLPRNGSGGAGSGRTGKSQQRTE